MLVLEPGEGGRVGTPLRYIRIVNLTLPQNQLPESIMANQIPLFARSFVHGKPRGINLYEVNPKTGEAATWLDTSGAPATNVMGPTGSGFYGLRWMGTNPTSCMANRSHRPSRTPGPGGRNQVDDSACLLGEGLRLFGGSQTGERSNRRTWLRTRTCLLSYRTPPILSHSAYPKRTKLPDQL